MGACIRDTLSREGPFAFYKGVTPPLLVCGIYNATLFSVNQAARNLVRPSTSAPGSDLSLPRLCAASILTAPASVIVLNPVEVVKIRLQLQTRTAGEAQYSGMLDCVAKTVRTEGVRALYTGAVATLMTRVVGLPFYFAAYELTKSWMQGPSVQGQPPAPPSTATALLSGVNAGYAFWTACYPIDYVKTRIQMSTRGTASAFRIVRETVDTHGFLGLYSGYTACMMRSGPANASVWLAMEKTIGLMAANGW
jgi:solute carrier family 25 carnitine/acylcarnitine transporter 20/29